MSQTMTPELFPSHGPSIRAALEVADADGVTAQRVASARATALQLGLPDSVVEADLQYAQREAQARRIEQNSPFALWAARSKERAALARDDTDGLSGVFSTAKAFGEIRQYEPGFWEALGTYLKEGSEDTAENIVATVGAIAGKLGANDFADQVERLAKQREKRRPAPLESNSAVQKYAGDVVRALPQFAGGVLSYIAGGPLGAVMFGAAQTGGSQYRSLRQENVERDRAFMAAAATAGLSAPLDALGTGKFLNIFKASGARQIFQNAGIAVGTDFVTEWLQTYPEEAARIWGLAEKNGTTLEEGVRLFFDNFWEMTKQGWYEGFVSMPFGLIGGAGKIAADRRASRDAQAFAEQNTALHDAVEASQTKQIAPEYMEDALDNASDVLAQSVYIPAQAALDLAGQGQDVLTPLGISQEAARQAAEAGVDLEVKLSSLHARLDDESMAAVAPLLRQTADAPNAQEAERADDAARVQAVVEDARQRRRRTEAVRQEEQRLVREMVPLVGKEAAETYGKLNSAQARAFEAAYGVDAAGLMRRRSVGLEYPGTTAGTSFDQTAYHGTPHKFKDFSLEHIGTGEGAQAHGWGLYFAQDRKVSEDYRNRLRTDRSRGQLFEVDIPENDVLLDEQKSFGEQPDAVKQALLAVYKSFPKERLAIVREEAKANVGRDKVLVDKGDKLNLERQQLFNQRRALKTVNAERPAGTNPFDPKSSAKLFDLGRDYLRQMYSPEQIARLENDAKYLTAEKAALKERLDDVARKIGENERRIEEKRKKDRDAIDRARLNTLLAKMDGASLYSGISAMADSPRAASELLNAHGIGGITYDGGQDGRSFVVFDDKAIDVLKTFYQEQADGVARAQVQIDSQTAAIRIFKGADMSSIPHETAHIFVDDLRRVAADDGGIARERLRADMEQAGIDSAELAAILSGDVDGERGRALLRDVREELASIEDSKAALRDASRAAGRGKATGGMREDMAAARESNEARRRELLPVERMLAGYVRHLDGLEQARRDMATLRRFAGMPEDGDLSFEQWREVQEYAARGFEQYLGEGRAPVKELDGVFSRMMRWLKNLYASWRQYVGADLDDDVRRVFDRLLATDEQIRNDPSLRAALELEQEFLADAGLTAAERRELEDLRDRAEAEVAARMDRAVARERGKRYRAAFSQAKESLQASPFWTFIREVSRRDKPLTDGEPGTGGIDRASLVEYLGEDMVKDIARKMPKLVNAGGRGDTVDSLAMQYPLTDGDADALAHLIYDNLVVEDASVNKLAARQAELALAEQDRAVSPEDGLLAGDAYGQYLEAVEKAMRRLGKDRQAQNEQAAARRMEQESLPDRYYRDMARREVADMSVAQLNPQRFVAALRRALGERSRAVVRGKPVEAVQAMQRARFAFAMMQEVRKARDLTDRVQKKARKAARVKPGTYPAAQTEAIRKLVSAFGLPAPQQAWDAQSGEMKLRDLVQQSVDDTEAIDLMPLFPGWLLDLANPDPAAARRGMALDWKELRPLEVEQVGNLLDFLVHSGREQSRTGKESLRAHVQAIANEAAASMSGMKTNYAYRRDSVADKLDKGFSCIDAIEWQCREADGFQDVPGRDNSTEGVMEREVYMRLRAATNRYHARLNSTHKAVMPHLVRLLQSAKAWEKKYGSKTLNVRDEKGNVVPLPEAMRMAGDPGWTAEMVIGMALNMGNAGNRERLRSSYIDGNGKGGLTYDMVSLLLGDDAAATLFELDAAAMGQMMAGRARRDGILSAADWQAIQGVWDVLGSQWADTQAAHKRIYGFVPQGIEPGAFAVRVGDETVRLPGGYYPIKYDPRLDMKMRAQEGKEDVLDRSEGIFGIPAARKGFTMGRVTHTGRSLRLGVQALQKHLVDSARFIELGYDVRMADKIINNPTFAAEYQRVFGMQDYDRFRPNLKGMVVDESVPDSMMLEAAELARKHLVYYALSTNIKTALMQLTAVFPAVGDVGLVNVSRGLAQLGTRGMGLVREVFAASPYMERRFRNIDDDLARKAMKFEPGRGMTLIRDGKVYTWEDVANLGMLPIAVADCAVTTAIWAGAYHKKMKELRGTAGWKMDRDSEYHSQAVAYADKIIAQSNPDNDALSKSAFGRDKGIVRLFNAFSGATTKFAQRTRYMWRGVKRGRVTKWEFARMEIYDMLLPAMSMLVMTGLAQGLFTGEDDDNKKLAKLALSLTMGQAAMAFPVVGNAGADMVVSLLGAGGGRRAGLSTALDTPIELLGKAVGQGGKAARDGDVDGEKLVMSALDLGSYISKIPVGPVTRRARRGYEQWQEGEGTPLSVIMPRSGN